MKHLSLIALCCMLIACTTLQGKSTLQRFYGLESDYQRVLITAIAYKDSCTPQPVSSPCHKAVKAIQSAVSKTDTALDLARTARALASPEADFAAKVNAAANALQEAEKLILTYTEKR